MLTLLLGLSVLILLIQSIALWRAFQVKETTQLSEPLERIERELRLQIQQTSQEIRQEQGVQFTQFTQTFLNQLSHIATAQNKQLEDMRLAMQTQAQLGREEQAGSLQRFAATLNQTLTNLTESNAKRMEEIRGTLENKIRELQTDNAARLEEMRKTVDEKLHDTLEKRLGESFKLVSERLEKVHQGLGEMQNLAMGVGDLKRVLTNVKIRGTWGEVQLEMLLEQMLTTEQFAKNVKTIPGSNAQVEFAIKLPGQSDAGMPVWMPIDAKFPKEQYERLIAAQEAVDMEAVKRARLELEQAVRLEAKKIAEKYVAPPYTTDFAILFLPTEGLYAEVMNLPGLADELQRTSRVMVAGPSTLAALLNSLQMGFRSFVLQKRSSEVWEILGAVRTEFKKFGAVLVKTKQHLELAAKDIEQVEVRTRQMDRKLKSVEEISSSNQEEVFNIDVT